MTARDPSEHQDAASGRTIIHRKAQAGRAEHQARAMSLGKALRLTLARSADDLFDLALAVIGVRFETCDGDDLENKLDGASLLMLLDGPSRARAAAAFDTSFVGALIQQQTMGKVIQRADGDSRAMTQTDAAICAPFLNDVLARAAGMPESAEEKRLITGYSFGAWVEDARVLSMALEAQEYRLIHVDLDIAGGLRQGKMMLCLPIAEAEVIVPEPSEGDDMSAARQPKSDALSETVQNLNAVLRVSLARVKVPLRALGKLEVGGVFEVGAPDFDAVRIETIAGQKISRGALGLMDGARAVRLHGASRTAEDQRWQGHKAESEGNALPETSFDEESEELAELPELPDISDDGALPELPDLPEMDGLPDLPDMSDLPEFDEGAELPQLNVG